MRIPRLLASASAIAVIGTALGVAGAAHDSDSAGVQHLPVITPGRASAAYPLAAVDAPLRLEDGCLLLADGVVFWPYGTTWDESAQAVVFRDGATARVGRQFVGGGGFYSLEDINRMLDPQPREAITRCMRETGAKGSAFAYP